MIRVSNKPTSGDKKVGWKDLKVGRFYRDPDDDYIQVVSVDTRKGLSCFLYTKSEVEDGLAEVDIVTVWTPVECEDIEGRGPWTEVDVEIRFIGPSRG